MTTSNIDPDTAELLEPTALSSTSKDTSSSWLDEASQEIDDVEVESFDIVTSPNDWNAMTIVSFIDSGALKIPAYQRNYVWDRKRASKLIESLIIGLPVPQVFLYEENRNEFVVIDGQQRLLSLYFFYKGRFPKTNRRGELRPSLSSGVVDSDLLNDDDLFEAFKLALPKSPGGKSNRLHGLSYQGLKSDKTSLDLRTIRNMVVKQVSPADDNSAVFEIFSRLNTGGVNLTPQEIRASLYHSDLFSSILEINADPHWRNLVGTPIDARMRDTEFLLRSLALARRGDSFAGSMSNFVNVFCLQAKRYTPEQANLAIGDMREFLNLFNSSHAGVFKRSSRFSGVLFESFFAAWIKDNKSQLDVEVISAAVAQVKESDEFAATLQEGSTKAVNVKGRISLAFNALTSQSKNDTNQG